MLLALHSLMLLEVGEDPGFVYGGRISSGGIVGGRIETSITSAAGGSIPSGSIIGGKIEVRK